MWLTPFLIFVAFVVAILSSLFVGEIANRASGSSTSNPGKQIDSIPRWLLLRVLPGFVAGSVFGGIVYAYFLAR